MRLPFRPPTVLLVLIIAGLTLTSCSNPAINMIGDRPANDPPAIDAIIRAEAAKYNLPRWFYYAIIQRESSFDPKAVSASGDGYGLTQLTGSWYSGQPYPENLTTPDNSNQDYRDDMNFGKFGAWLQMTNVTPLTDHFDVQQNLDRFSTGYAVPAFVLFKKVYGLSDNETLRAVAFHWNRGVYLTYDPNNTSYLTLYDRYVSVYQPKVEAVDGVWNGSPHLP